MRALTLLSLSAVTSLPSTALACTNLIVTPGASADGSTIYSYAADSAGLYGTIDRYPARKNIPDGTKRKIYDWDSGKYLGEIDEAKETYDVTGNMNEFQLVIGETTFGGLPQLCKGQKNAVIDYGTLIVLGLQRSKTAKEAIKVMTDLVAKYGYASEGESFTIADKKEVWILELIGKADLDKENPLGAVWVAQKVPDGHITSHANQARIRYFPENYEDESNFIYAKDVKSFALKNKLWDGKSEFSFSDIYDPVTFVGVRAGEARVWSFLSKFSNISGFEAKYYEYASGKMYWQKERMPWSTGVKEKLSVKDVTRC